MGLRMNVKAHQNLAYSEIEGLVVMKVSKRCRYTVFVNLKQTDVCAGLIDIKSY